MVKLIPVKYRIFDYPAGIQSNIQEVAGHFGKSEIFPKGAFSLHTEYSFDSKHSRGTLLQDFPTLCNCVDRGIPLLWYSNEWAEEFVAFIQKLCGNHIPKIIEIHPPYSDYYNLDKFISIYRTFEAGILRLYPDVELLIENRSGTARKYKDGGKIPFAFEYFKHLISLSSMLDESNLRLKIAFDAPQLLTAHNLWQNQTGQLPGLFEHLKPITHNIHSVHLWGKNPQPHNGDFNTAFESNPELKRLFLSGLYQLLDDGVPRYFVPEVNSGRKDFISIISDLRESGFTFV